MLTYYWILPWWSGPSGIGATVEGTFHIPKAQLTTGFLLYPSKPHARIRLDTFEPWQSSVFQKEISPQRASFDGKIENTDSSVCKYWSWKNTTTDDKIPFEIQQRQLKVVVLLDLFQVPSCRCIIGHTLIDSIIVPFLIRVTWFIDSVIQISGLSAKCRKVSKKRSGTWHYDLIYNRPKLLPGAGGR